MRMAQADRLTAIALLMLGLAMLAGGWGMDRLEVRRIHPASIPGLVPMILGLLLAVCAGLLWRAAGSGDARGDAPVLTGGSWSRLGLTALTCVIYALGLVGWLSYFWATAIFTTAFALIFSYPVNGTPRARTVAVGGAMALGLGVAFGSALLFEKLFLVRLP